MTGEYNAAGECGAADGGNVATTGGAQLIHGSLFAGIGGFDLGFEWAGIETLWQVEIDEYCQQVLEKHWPDVIRHGDIREVHGEEVCPLADTSGKSKLGENPPRGKMDGELLETARRDKSSDGFIPICPQCLPCVDIISGGFPCQDISVAGKQAGIEGLRSGLWSEMHRIIGELRPRYAVIENVPNLIRLGLDRVLCDLAEIGYDAEWQVVGADDVGAPHRRKRIWIIAYPQGTEGGGLQQSEFQPNARTNSETKHSHPNESRSIRDRRVPQGQQHIRGGQTFSKPNTLCENVADPECNRSQRTEHSISGKETPGLRRRFADSNWWSVEPDVGRVAHGIPARVHRLKGLGNAIVPQIAEIIGRMIIQTEETP